MHFGFPLDSSDIDLWNIDLLDTRLDLLDIDIPNKHFVCSPSKISQATNVEWWTCDRNDKDINNCFHESQKTIGFAMKREMF